MHSETSRGQRKWAKRNAVRLAEKGHRTCQSSTLQPLIITLSYKH